MFKSEEGKMKKSSDIIIKATNQMSEKDQSMEVKQSSCYVDGSMQVFFHHIYEYEKGLRNLILHTSKGDHKATIKNALERKGIPFLIVSLKNKHINVFFGHGVCIDVIKAINKKRLVDYTPEEDFMLGIMLGYERKLQCERYLKLRASVDVPEIIG